MGKEGKTGVSADTPKNVLFGAGTIHRGLKYDPTAKEWNFEESIIGATQGGSKISIVPEFVDVEADGVNVLTTGLKQKTGESAKMEINLIELTKEILKASIIAKEESSEDTNYELLVSKANIEEGDYLENIAFVGRKLDGKMIIAIMENALCTSGFESEGKSKEGAVGKYTFECHADIAGEEFDVLPWKIYFPKTVA